MATHQESGQLNLVQSYELQNYVAVELVALSNTVAGFQPSQWVWTVPPDSCSISSVATSRSLRLLETLCTWSPPTPAAAARHVPCRGCRRGSGTPPRTHLLVSDRGPRVIRRRSWTPQTHPYGRRTALNTLTARLQTYYSVFARSQRHLSEPTISTPGYMARAHHVPRRQDRDQDRSHRCQPA